MLIVASDDHRGHDGLEVHDGALVRSFESPERAELIRRALDDRGWPTVGPDAVDHELLARVHTPDHLELLATAWDRWVERGESAPAAMPFAWPPRGSSAPRPDDLLGQLGYHSFSADTSIVAGTWAAVVASAAIATTAAARVLGGERTAYGLCRPPGHHASADQFGGYCYLNNAAIAAQRLLDGGRRRVGVLDVDYHHGNGTQSIFLDRDEVVTVSIHADPREEFPWFSGHADERGVRAGEGCNLNIPLPRGTGAARWGEALERALAELGAARIEALVVSLGVDTYVGDPLGTFELETADLERCGASVAGVDVPTVVVQEGGYAVDAVGLNVVAFLGGLSPDGLRSGGRASGGPSSGGASRAPAP
ncbi:histone deacetylase family protein [Ilumatobacter sp.]|uniref:histone deacetylase family protein n=1 Tax=Ilumatobacter sp. TaxID=1967498 RepID=UPI003B520CFD